jgi:SAM-dependent methyltransferase
MTPTEAQLPRALGRRSASTVLRSYSSLPGGARTRLREFVELYRWQSGDVQVQVDGFLTRLRRVEDLAFAHTGRQLRGMRLLEIGCGQRFNQSKYFAQWNDVVAIDLDVIARGLNPLPYLAMLRENGPIRFTKTLGRKLLGVDRRSANELRRRLGGSPRHKIAIHRMDASRMTFADGSFDGVVSFAVFEHLNDAEAVLRETVRVMKPGGVACIALHLYTAENGCHDPRIFSGNRAGIPLWSHLRPRYKHLVAPNAFLNEIRLPDWETLFSRHMPSVRVEHVQPERDRLLPELRRIRDGGELLDYSEEELLTVDLIAIWRKP